VQLLLRHGANPLSKNSDLESPLDVASTPSVRRLLRSEIIASSSSESSLAGSDLDLDLDLAEPRSPTSPETGSDANVSSPPPPPDTAVRHTHLLSDDDTDKHSDGQQTHPVLDRERQCADNTDKFIS